ncbi:hypothetical protein MPDQ_005173 [Monascus purpureus]|uniref:Uncharacterized protein n=1 Tax=Monascus purpureus TaxID=5098 RepID=A0A507QJ06_MONPU|nr:hypothetical protein MPDQ_005173 [Monascus purpureus]
MSISLDKINFCYQYPPPKTGTTSRWKPYQVPSASAHSPHRTCLLPSEPGVSTVSAPTRSGAAETTQSLTISPGGSTMGIRNEFDVGIEASTSEPAQIQTSDGDSHKNPHYKTIVLDDISPEQSEEQASLLMQPAMSFDSGLVATEPEISAFSRARTLGSPEESIEVSRISCQSTARSTPSICDDLCARISRPSSIGVLEHMLNLGREPQTENSHTEESTVGDSQGQEAASYRATDAVNKADCMESLRYGPVGPEDQSAVTGERGDSGAAASGPKRSPIRQSCRIPCHPQTNIRESKRIRPVSENSPIREPSRQKTTTTKNTLCRTPYVCERSNKDYESEGYPTLTSKPIGESNERLSKRCGHLPQIETTAGCTSALANDTTREHSNSLQRPPDGSFPSTAGEAQEIFGRGILRIQPHGPRNAYVITFLPDVVQPASMPSTSDMSWEKPPHSTSRGRANQLSAPVADSVPGAQEKLPIDPLILADDGPWEAGDLDQPFSLSDDPNPSETICPYPDPRPFSPMHLASETLSCWGMQKRLKVSAPPTTVAVLRPSTFPPATP